MICPKCYICGFLFPHVLPHFQFVGEPQNRPVLPDGSVSEVGSWPHRTDEEYLWLQSGAVDLPQFPFPSHLKCRLTSFFFLYLHTPFYGIPLCHIHAVTHLGAARYNHNRTTGHWAAPLKRLGIKCFAQGQLVIFERRESISYSFSTLQSQNHFSKLYTTTYSTPFFPAPDGSGAFVEKTGDAISTDMLRNPWPWPCAHPSTATSWASPPNASSS